MEFTINPAFLKANGKERQPAPMRLFKKFNRVATQLKKQNQKKSMQKNKEEKKEKKN